MLAKQCVVYAAEEFIAAFIRESMRIFETQSDDEIEGLVDEHEHAKSSPILSASVSIQY